MRTPRVFISYTGRDAVSPALRDAVCSELVGADPEHPDFDVFVDAKRLVPGTEWRDELYAWLGRCDVAIVLLSPAAVGLVDGDTTRPLWVPREATILSWRRRLDRSFVVVPVLVDGLRLDQLPVSQVAELEFEDQHLVVDDGAAVAALAGRVAAVVRSHVSNRRETPGDVLVKHLRKVLRRVDTDTVDEAADAVGIDLGGWSPASDPREHVAVGLLHLPFDQVVAAVETMVEGVDELAVVRDVIDAIKPSWVSWEAAVVLSRCAGAVAEGAAPAGQTFVLNGATDFAVDCYVARASGKPPRTRWPAVHPRASMGEASAALLIEKAQQQLLRRLIPGRHKVDTDSLARLQQVIVRRAPVFVSFAPGPEVPSAIRTLLGAFPGLHAIVRRGDRELTPDYDGLKPCAVLPELTPGVELNALARHDTLCSFVVEDDDDD